jgi:hypothetical protein
MPESSMPSLALSVADPQPSSPQTEPSWTGLPAPGEIDVANAAQLHADLLLAVDCGHGVVVADMSLSHRRADAC